jgi:hypothetical protein
LLRRAGRVLPHGIHYPLRDPACPIHESGICTTETFAGWRTEMKKWKVVIIIVLVLGIAALATCVAIDFSSSPKFILSNNSIEYHTKEELTELYWQQKELLNTVKDDVLSSDKLLKALNDLMKVILRYRRLMQKLILPTKNGRTSYLPLTNSIHI